MQITYRGAQASLENIAQKHLSICQSKKLPSSVIHTIGVSIILAGLVCAATTFVFPPAVPFIALGAAVGIIAYTVNQFSQDHIRKQSFTPIYEKIISKKYSEAYALLEGHLRRTIKGYWNSPSGAYMKVFPYENDQVVCNSLIFYTSFLSACEGFEQNGIVSPQRLAIVCGGQLRGGGYSGDKIQDFIQNNQQFVHK